MSKYCDKFDAHYDNKKDTWLEKKCCETDTTDCYFKCYERPDKPSQVRRYDENEFNKCDTECRENNSTLCTCEFNKSDKLADCRTSKVLHKP